jgi:arsenite methyltransferase
MNIYESAAWRHLPEGAMRPGGLKLTEHLLDLAQLPRQSCILDIGCGLGSTVSKLSALGYKPMGIDISAGLIEEGRLRFPDQQLLVADAADIPLPAASFDAILAECSLSVMPADKVLRQCWRLLRPHGKLLISDIYARKASEVDNTPALGACLLTENQWLQLVGQSGFTKIQFSDCSDVFKEFAIKVIWEYGSLDKLFDCGQWSNAASAKPGYFLLICEKEV